MNKPTIESAIIEANRAKNPGRPTTDYDHRARCMDVLIDADKLTKNMRNYYPSIYHLCFSQHVVTKGDIDNAPTVIEAEVSR